MSKETIMIGYFTLIPVKKGLTITKEQQGIYKDNFCYVDKNMNLFIDGVQNHLYFAIDTGIKPEFEDFVIKGKQTNVVYYTHIHKNVPTEDWFNMSKYARTFKADEFTRKVMFTTDRDLLGVHLMNHVLLHNFEKLYNENNPIGSQYIKSNLFHINYVSDEISLRIKK